MYRIMKKDICEKKIDYQLFQKKIWASKVEYFLTLSSKWIKISEILES